MKIHEGTMIILALVGGAVALMYLTSKGGFQHGFYTADYAGHQGVPISRNSSSSAEGVGGA